MQRENGEIMKTFVAILVVLVVALGAYYYINGQKPAGPPERGTATIAVQSILITGVKNDLNQISSAEQAYLAQNGKYASLDELIDSGALRMEQRTRQGYSYSVDFTASGFTITARYSGPAQPPYPSYRLDSATREIRPVP